MGVVERYLAAVASQDWAATRDCLTEDVRRVGPFGDVYEGRETYLGFLRQVMPTLAAYRMDVHRVLTADAGTVAVAELSETVDVGNGPEPTHESLVLDLDESARICHIAIYIQRAE